MNSKVCKLLRRYSEVKKIPYNRCKATYASADNKLQQVYLKEIKTILQASKTI